MTCYILIMTEDGEDSYSVWKTEAGAKAEMRYLMQSTGLSIYAFNILETEMN